MSADPRVVILAYHSLTPWPGDPLGVDPEEFRQQIEGLIARGWSCLSLAAWVTHLERGTRPSARSVVVTFDDGYADNLHRAAPILETCGWTATVFLVPDALRTGAVFDHDLKRQRAEPSLPERRSMTWGEASEWRARGFDIGSHTRSHRPLTTLDSGAVESELVESRRELRERLVSGDLFFTYPHGALDPLVVGAVRDAGYRAAVLTPRSGRIPRTPWTLPRIGVYARDTGVRFRIKMHAAFPASRSARFFLLGQGWPRCSVPHSARPRVLELTTSSEVGGIEKMLGRLVPALKREGIEAEVLSLDQSGAAEDLLQREGVPLLGLRSRGLLGAALELARLTRARQYDCIHAYGTRALLVARVGAWLARGGPGQGLPRVVTGVLSSNHGAEWMRRLADLLTGAASDLHLSNSTAGAEALVARGIVPLAKTRVIRDGIDLERDGGKRERSQVRRELGLAAEARVIISVANLRPMKGHESLIRAAARIVERHPEACFLFVGQDRMGGALQQLASRLLPTGEIQFLGYRADIGDLLAASDVFVLASDWEGLPVSMLEAMLSGLPVVATRVSGIPEAVTDGEEGWLVPPRDPERLAAAIDRLLDDPAAATAMGQRGRQRVLREFSLRRAARATADLYRELVHRAAPARLALAEVRPEEPADAPLTLTTRLSNGKNRPIRPAA